MGYDFIAEFHLDKLTGLILSGAPLPDSGDGDGVKKVHELLGGHDSISIGDFMVRCRL